MEGRVDLVLEDLVRDGPGSLLVMLRLLSRAEGRRRDLGLLSSGAVSEEVRGRVERGVSGSKYRS